MKKRIISALYLSKMNRSQKVTQGTATHDAVDASAFFPASAEKTARLNALKEATTGLAAADAATASGSHESYAQADTAELQFDTELRNMSYYVQTIADADPVNAEEIILAAALKIKKSSSKMKPPMPVDDVSVKVTGLGNAVKMHIFSDNPRSTHFEIQMTTTPNDENSWDSIADITARKYLVQDLVNGVRYYFRVRAINSMGRSIYSDIVSQVAA
ncbi:MAG TPA: fibronectin type III domain-containing protein [Bacteroidia bacterium]|nr:fibronectin type III domain-containing protein [Bacteroidia bacterium]HNU34267.1 fibronectin type III domain-containing protein [Bacteroidia bacterium]